MSNHRHKSSSSFDKDRQLCSNLYMARTRRPGIREAYTALGLTRRMFALRVDLTPQTITNIVNGGTLSDAAAIRIGAALGWSKEAVFAGTPDAADEDKPARPDTRPDRGVA